jgi:hypothetical protein
MVQDFENKKYQAKRNLLGWYEGGKNKSDTLQFLKQRSVFNLRLVPYHMVMNNL